MCWLSFFFFGFFLSGYELVFLSCFLYIAIATLQLNFGLFYQ